MALSPATVSVGRREMERARYTEWEIRSIPRGRWLYSGVRAGRLMPPVVLKALMPTTIPTEGTQRTGWSAQETQPRREETPENRHKVL